MDASVSSEGEGTSQEPPTCCDGSQFFTIYTSFSALNPIWFLWQPSRQCWPMSRRWKLRLGSAGPGVRRVLVIQQTSFHT